MPRKPLDPKCNGGVFCVVPGHVVTRRFKDGTGRTSHIRLTLGQRKTLRESGRRPGVLG